MTRQAGRVEVDRGQDAIDLRIAGQQTRVHRGGGVGGDAGGGRWRRGGCEGGRYGGIHRCGLDQGRDAGVIAQREGAVEVGGEGAGDPLAQAIAEAAAEATDDGLADQEAVGVHVVAVGRARRPVGRLRGEGVRHCPPVEDRVGRERPAYAGQAASMGEQHAERRIALVVGSELGPVPRDGAIEVELAAFDE